MPELSDDQLPEVAEHDILEPPEPAVVPVEPQPDDAESARRLSGTGLEQDVIEEGCEDGEDGVGADEGGVVAVGDDIDLPAAALELVALFVSPAFGTPG